MKCPYCGNEAEAEFVDNGVGMQQVSPYCCPGCGAVQIGPNDEPKELTQREKQTGWYEGSFSDGMSTADADRHAICLIGDLLLKSGKQCYSGDAVARAVAWLVNNDPGYFEEKMKEYRKALDEEILAFQNKEK